MAFIVTSLVLGVGASSQSEVAPPVHHVHRKRVVFVEQKAELLQILSHIFALEILAPVGQPP